MKQPDRAGRHIRSGPRCQLPGFGGLALQGFTASRLLLEAVQQLGDQTAPETVPANIRATAAQRLE